MKIDDISLDIFVVSMLFISLTMIVGVFYFTNKREEETKKFQKIIFLYYEFSYIEIKDLAKYVTRVFRLQVILCLSILASIMAGFIAGIIIYKERPIPIILFSFNSALYIVLTIFSFYNSRQVNKYVISMSKRNTTLLIEVYNSVKIIEVFNNISIYSYSGKPWDKSPEYKELLSRIVRKDKVSAKEKHNFCSLTKIIDEGFTVTYKDEIINVNSIFYIIKTE